MHKIIVVFKTQVVENKEKKKKSLPGKVLSPLRVYHPLFFNNSSMVRLYVFTSEIIFLLKNTLVFAIFRFVKLQLLCTFFVSFFPFFFFF